MNETVKLIKDMIIGLAPAERKEAMDILYPFVRDERRRAKADLCRLDAHRLMGIYSQAFDITEDYILRSKSHQTNLMKFSLYKVLYDMGYTLEDIEYALGKNTATIISGIRKIEDELDLKYADTRSIYTMIKS